MEDKAKVKKVGSEEELVDTVVRDMAEKGFALTDQSSLPAVPGESRIDQQARLAAEIIARMRSGQR